MAHFKSNNVTMWIDYEKVCEIFKQAVPFNSSPAYVVTSEATKSKNDILQMKIEKFHRNKKWKERILNEKEEFKSIGSYEIGNFTGSEILQIFYDIFVKKDGFQVGNYLCFSSKESDCFAVMLNDINPQVVSLPPPDDDGLKYVYTKLFDDDSLAKSKSTSKYRSPENIKGLRQNAKVHFKAFMTTKFSEFALHPFGVTFLGLLAETAIHSTLKYGHTKHIVEVPFAACVKLAFDANLTGDIAKMFGEISDVSKEEGFSFKALNTKKTAEKIISR